jgi:hypothetical protein
VPGDPRPNTEGLGSVGAHSWWPGLVRLPLAAAVAYGRPILAATGGQWRRRAVTAAGPGHSAPGVACCTGLDGPQQLGRSAMVVEDKWPSSVSTRVAGALGQGAREVRHEERKTMVSSAWPARHSGLQRQGSPWWPWWHGQLWRRLHP